MVRLPSRSTRPTVPATGDEADEGGYDVGPDCAGPDCAGAGWAGAGWAGGAEALGRGADEVPTGDGFNDAGDAAEVGVEVSGVRVPESSGADALAAALLVPAVPAVRVLAGAASDGCGPAGDVLLDCASAVALGGGLGGVPGGLEAARSPLGRLGGWVAGGGPTADDDSPTPGGIGAAGGGSSTASGSATPGPADSGSADSGSAP
ncbi:MAG TPA: hypothetical protein VIQ30_18010, partial [Pseudonocardia sp.]